MTSLNIPLLAELPAMPCSLRGMCDDAYSLNVLAREHRLMAVSHAAYYILKDSLIRYLYLSGHALEVLQHTQTLECWDCGGIGCKRCHGTGVYRTGILYAFLFQVGGRRYRWHQPAARIRYPVTLTKPAAIAYNGAMRGVDPDARSQVWMYRRLKFGLWIRGALG